MPIPLPVRTVRSGWPFYFRGIEKIRLQIDPENFSPYPKNPMIARFFKEIGRVDELGSGIRNTYKYCGLYTPGTDPEFIEGDVFKAIIQIQTEQVTGQATKGS
jgi:ATP-dependent DNA helicase RecG